MGLGQGWTCGASWGRAGARGPHRLEIPEARDGPAVVERVEHAAQHEVGYSDDQRRRHGAACCSPGVLALPDRVVAQREAPQRFRVLGRLVLG